MDDFDFEDEGDDGNWTVDDNDNLANGTEKRDQNDAVVINRIKFS